MGIFNKIGSGLLVGFGISFLVAYIIFQFELFRQGAESIGVSFFGFGYFFGGLISSIILVALSKGRSQARYLVLFFVAIIAVGSIGLNNVIADSNAGNSLDVQRNMTAISRVVAQVFFWSVPAIMVILYGFALYEARHKKPE